MESSCLKRDEISASADDPQRLVQIGFERQSFPSVGGARWWTEEFEVLTAWENERRPY